MALMAFVAIIGPIARLLGLEPWHVGFAVTSAGAAWTVLARQWGRASDRYGRRRIMLVGLAGFALSYALLCAFIDAALRLSWPALTAFIGISVARTLAGAFYAAVPASSVALIADHFPSDRRAAAIAGLGAANGMGMVFGPAVAGLLAQYDITFSLAFIAVLPVFSVLVIWRAVPRDPRATLVQSPPLRLKDQRLRLPLGVAFVAMFCVAVAQITVGFYALDRLSLTPARGAQIAGIALGAVGAALIVAQMLVRELNWTQPRLIRTGATISGLGFGFAIFATNEWLLWASYFIGAAGMGFIFPAFFALAADVVEKHEQGAAAGAISSVQGLGAILGPLAGTTLYQVDIRAPYAMIAVTMFVMALLVSERRTAADPIACAQRSLRAAAPATEVTLDVSSPQVAETRRPAKPQASVAEGETGSL